MRIRNRKRTPASAASPGPPSPPTLPLQQPMFLVQEKPREEEEEEEEEGKRAILAAGVRDGGEDDDDRVRVRPVVAAAAASGNGNSSSRTADVPKPEPHDAAAARCSRNDGKRWRCKKAAVPGYLFCDRHIAWSTRKRKPKKCHGSGVPEAATIPIAKEFAEDRHETQRNAGLLGGF